MDKTKATTTNPRTDQHDYCPGIPPVGLCGEYDVGAPKVQFIWVIVRYIFGLSSEVTLANQSTTNMYGVGEYSDGFYRLDLDYPVVDEKAETLRAMELATRMG